MRIVHYKSVAVKLVIHATLVKSGGFPRRADFHALYYARRGQFVRPDISPGGRRGRVNWAAAAVASRYFAPTSTA